MSGLNSFVNGYNTENDNDNDYDNDSRDDELVSARQDVQEIFGRQELEGFILNSPASLVSFGAEWCRHCQQLLPRFKALNRRLREINSPTHVARVECTDPRNEQLCRAQGVRAYPTVKIFSQSSPPLGEIYNGETTSDGFEAFLRARRLWDL